MASCRFEWLSASMLFLDVGDIVRLSGVCQAWYRASLEIAMPLRLSFKEELDLKSCLVTEVDSETTAWTKSMVRHTASGSKVLDHDAHKSFLAWLIKRPQCATAILLPNRDYDQRQVCKLIRTFQFCFNHVRKFDLPLIRWQMQVASCCPNVTYINTDHIGETIDVKVYNGNMYSGAPLNCFKHLEHLNCGVIHERHGLSDGLLSQLKNAVHDMG